MGDGADPAFKSVNETLMPSGAVLSTEEAVSLRAEVPAELAEATVVKEMNELRVRYDFSVAVNAHRARRREESRRRREG